MASHNANRNRHQDDTDLKVETVVEIFAYLAAVKNIVHISNSLYSLEFLFTYLQSNLTAISPKYPVQNFRPAMKRHDI